MPEHLEFFLSFTATNKNTVYYRICLRIHLVLFILNPFTLSMFFLFLSFSSFHVLPLISLFAVFKEEKNSLLKIVYLLRLWLMDYTYLYLYLTSSESNKKTFHRPIVIWLSMKQTFIQQYCCVCTVFLFIFKLFAFH